MKNKFDGVPIPVKEGEKHTVVIESIGEKGDGIAKINGFVVIVPGVEQGQQVEIQITAIRGRVGFGQVI